MTKNKKKMTVVCILMRDSKRTKFKTFIIKSSNFGVCGRRGYLFFRRQFGAHLIDGRTNHYYHINISIRNKHYKGFECKTWQLER